MAELCNFISMLSFGVSGSIQSFHKRGNTGQEGAECQTMKRNKILGSQDRI